MEEMNVHFFGDVHGVGFRATTFRIAQKLKLTGYVRNSPDGSVEIVAQGSQEKLENLVQQLQSVFKNCITKFSMNFRKPTQKYSDFTISR